MMDVTDANFEEEVLKSDKPVVVDMWAPWCGPCRLLSPIIEEVSKEMGSRAKFCKLNTDENPGTAAKYNIMSIPSVLLFKKGEVSATSVGALPKASFKQWLDRSL
ncbi:MAG: thioredoxin [Candidatus Marsarchaeota archaeon]|nr:thioredoxin [Candidatus Marsarchaeota archaeon]